MCAEVLLQHQGYSPPQPRLAPGVGRHDARCRSTLQSLGWRLVAQRHRMVWDKHIRIPLQFAMINSWRNLWFGMAIWFLSG